MLKNELTGNPRWGQNVIDKIFFGGGVDETLNSSIKHLIDKNK